MEAKEADAKALSVADSEFPEPPDFPKGVNEMSGDDWTELAAWGPKADALFDKVLSES